jgi:pyruvate/2-oxoglutarate/acetoin dehydrogenase E1 component
MPDADEQGRSISFASAINEALDVALELDPTVLCYGLGVPDPKGVFGTTSGLQAKYGPSRVFDMPTSENAMTGVATGAALGGLKPVMTHQRLDFFLLAMDQLVNGAAKWHYMYGGQTSVPLTIRLIVGRGWGQGPTHSQNLQAWFAHIPGLKVVMPTTPADAKGLLLSSIFDPNPVIFIENRWLHNFQDLVPDGDVRVKIGAARIAREGTDVTIVASAYLTVEAIAAADHLATRGVSAEVIDLRTIKPLDWPTIQGSVAKTGRLIAVDSGFTTGSIAGDIVARVAQEQFDVLKCAPQRLAMPDVPEPTSPALTRGFYIRAGDIAETALGMVGKAADDVRAALPEPTPHDVPGTWFKGPF